MTKKLRLHYAPDNASLCVRIALEELRIPYDTQLVDRANMAQKSPTYLELNPNGLIPVLETPHGAMFETAAILLWLSDKYGSLLPATDAPERAHALQWLIWLANTLHPTLRVLFYPDQFSKDEPNAFRVVARTMLKQQLCVLENAPNAPWIDQDRASAQASYLGPLLRWPALYGGDTSWFDLTRYPRLFAFAQLAEQRPAVKRAAIAEGLGPTPFSVPQPCNPPEGTAT